MIEELIRSHLRSFKPYTSARSEVQQARVLLDANELSFGSPVEFEGIALNRYPDPFQSRLRAKLAETSGVSSDQVFVGAGSDEIIDLLVRLFCEPGRDSVAILEPTYGVYRVAADVSGVEAVAIDLDDEFQLDARKMIDSLRPTTKIVFLCSPNNPTGNLLNREEIVAFCKLTRAIVVVDQAYVEFAESNGNIVSELSRCNNLVILRTLSKAWGLAGIRLGYCLCDPLIVSYLLRIKSPYNVNAITSEVAWKSLERSEFLRQSTKDVIRERTRLALELKELPFVNRVYRSDANFLLVSFKNAGEVFRHLSKRGIVVRRRNEERLKDCLRMTVGTSAENDLILSVLKEYE